MKKINYLQFGHILTIFIKDTVIYESILARINDFRPDKQGYIEESDIDMVNKLLMSFLNNPEMNTDDENEKYRTVLKMLLPSGSDKVSNDIEKFQNSGKQSLTRKSDLRAYVGN